MTFYDNYLEQAKADARLANLSAIDDDPEQAAKALDLEDAMGVPAGAIYGDVEGFERSHRAALGSAIIDDNPNIVDYINSHPMAARVSSDDLGQLDMVSQAVKPLGDKSPFAKWLESNSIQQRFETAARALVTPPKAFSEGFGNQPIGSSILQRPDDVEWTLSHPALASVALAGVSVPETFMRATSGLMNLGHEGIASVFGEGVAREAQAMAEWAMMRGDIGVHPEGPLKAIEQNSKLIDTLKETAKGLELADPWTNIGKTPPQGLHPLIDEAHASQAKDDMRALDAAVSEANKSATRERSPEMFAQFLRGQVGNRTVRISAEAIRSLYGDKPPSPDDGILGWVPGIQESLPIAEAAGADISVPLADYLAKTEPETHKALHDFISIRDNTPTIDETKIGTGKPSPLPSFEDTSEAMVTSSKPIDNGHPEPEAKTAIADPVSMIRASGGLEPMFSIGDRKIELRRKEPEGEQPDWAKDMNTVDIHDETGKQIGTIILSEQKGGKRLYIEDIQAGTAANDYYQPNFLGPALVRDLRRQLKAMFPNAEELTGHRATGARFAGRDDKYLPPQSVSAPVIKFDEGNIPKGWTQIDADTRELLQGYWENRPGVDVFHPEQRSIEHDILQQAIRSELERIAPKMLGDITVAGKLQRTGGKEVGGLYQRFINKLPEILVSMDEAQWGERKGIGIARHEAIHHLRKYGFLDEGEWSTLEAASKEHGWSDRYLKGRYEGLDSSSRLEESIAEAYRAWKFHDEKNIPEGVQAIFAKIKEFIEAIKTKFKELAGKDLNWDEIFRKIDTGEIGSREGTTPLEENDARPFNEPQISFSEADGEGTPRPPTEGLFDRGKALGVTQAHMDRMLKLIDKRNAEDLAASQRRAELRHRRRSNKEWKERRTVLRDEVREQLSGRPDIALDQTMAKYKIKIDPAYLSEDQRARLPKDYVQKKDGINPDDIAPYFGYTSGDALVERLGMLTEDRRRGGMSPRDYLNRLIDVETDRRLNQEFGDRDQHILDEAKDQALSETQLRLVHEETMAYALKAGQEPQFTHDQVKGMVRQAFEQVPVGQISSDRLLQTALKHGKKIEEAGARGKWDEAYRLSQQRQYAVVAAKYAREYERERRALDRTAKTFRKREVPTVAQEYTNWIHDLIQRVGYPLGRTIQDLQENIARQPSTTIDQFKAEKEAMWTVGGGAPLRELPIAGWVLDDPTFRKKLDELSHFDFMAFKSTIDGLVKAGRDEKKIYREGEAAERATVMSEMMDNLHTFNRVNDPARETRVGKFLSYPRSFFAGQTGIETLLNRWDRANSMGVFNRFINQPLAAAGNLKNVMEREVAGQLRELGPIPDRNKKVDAPFADPLTRSEDDPEGEPWANFDRSHVMAMLQNAGNKSNWNVLAKGYGQDPAALKAWLEKNVTIADIKRAEGLGKIFSKLVAKADGVYERLTGATVHKIPLEPITFNTREGPYTTQGWYHPLIRSATREEVWEKDADTGLWSRRPTGKRGSVYDDADYFHASTANGYTMKRTGATYPLELNFDLVGARLKQMIHDIALRETILETDKVFSNKAFRAEVIKHYGLEYADLLRPYLEGVAGAESIPSRAVSKFTQLSEYFRQNVISTLIGFNPYTALKHGPTALVMSSREVGPTDFARAVTQLYGKSPELGLTNSEFALKHSEELQRRERHWQDTISGESRRLEGDPNWRAKLMEKGSWLVAQSDMLSAKPTWLAAFNRAMAEGNSFGDSVALGDRAVRRAHGSTSITNQPIFVAQRGALHGWLTSVYGFFGTAMQRRIEIAHKLADTYDLGRAGDFRSASANVMPILADVMTYVVWPTIVEEAVTGMTTEDRRGWGSHIAAGAFMGLSSSVLYLRDLVQALATGHEPTVGLFGAPAQDISNAVRDYAKGSAAFSHRNAGKTVGDTLNVLGHTTGMAPKTLNNAIRFGIDLVNHQAQPRNPAEVIRGVTRGHTQRSVER